MSAYPAFDYDVKKNTLYLTDSVEEEEKKNQSYFSWLLPLLFFLFVCAAFASFFVFFELRSPVSVVVLETEPGIKTKVGSLRRPAFLNRFQSSSCLDCICQKESDCHPIGCVMDEGSLSCGYFQIKVEYYMDCGEPGKGVGESTETAWKRCAGDMSCSIECVDNYINRYRGNCPGRGDCEQRRGFTTEGHKAVIDRRRMDIGLTSNDAANATEDPMGLRLFMSANSYLFPCVTVYI